MRSTIRAILVACTILFGFIGSARADSAATRPTLKIAVAPFDVQGESGHEWLGRAMQEGLATGLQGSSPVSGIIIAGIAPVDSAAAIAMAKDSGADGVIFGSIQIIGDQMRVAGQIISMRSGQSVGALRSDGAQRDLFNIEDALAARVQRIVFSLPQSNHQSVAAAPATLAVVGPTVAGGAPRYFDGNVISRITPAPQFRDEYDRYYYQTADTSAWGSCCGAGWGFGGCGYGAFSGGAFGGGAFAVGYNFAIATPVHGW